MSDTDLEEETKTKLKKPSKWAVVLHNNDVTPMNFVVELLKFVFRHSEVSAHEVMINVHLNGKGVAGIYTLEIAEQKLEEAQLTVQLNGEKLKLSLEEQES